MTEELHEDTLSTGRILVHQDPDHAPSPERLQYRPQGAPLVDHFDAGPATEALGDRVEPGRVERTDDDREAVLGQAVGGAEDLPVAEVGGEDKRATVGSHRRMQMLEPVQANPRQGLVERRGQQPWQLDQCHPEMLGSAARESAALGFRQRRIGAAQIGEGDAAAPSKRGVREVPQTPAKPECHGERDVAGGRCEAAGGYAERRRRSLYSSTAIGISDSTITITTTT